MTFVATAIIGSAVIGGYTASTASKRAARTQQRGYDSATEESRRQYDLTRSDYAPWREAGQDALTQLQDPNQYFEKSPGYQFRLDESTRNLENRFSVGGGGGNAMRALAEFGQGFASNEYGNWWNRQAGRAGLGLNATQGTANAGEANVNRVANNYIGAANANASGIMGSAAGWNNALQSGVGNWLYASGRGLFDKDSGSNTGGSQRRGRG